MRNRLVITLCAVVSLLAGAGLLTFWLVRALAPAAALNYTPWPLSPEPYTGGSGRGPGPAHRGI